MVRAKYRKRQLCWVGAGLFSLISLTIAGWTFARDHNEPQGKMRRVRSGIWFEGFVVVPSAGVLVRSKETRLIDVRLTAVTAPFEREHMIGLKAVRSRFLDGHPIRLQAGFGRIWQLLLDDFGINDREASVAAHWVDSTPSLKVKERLGIAAPNEGAVMQHLSDPLWTLSVQLGRILPRLRSTLQRSHDDHTVLPVFYYDFAITGAQNPTTGANPAASATGIMFLQHRYELETWVLAIPFPVGREEPLWERIPVPFAEPFHCAVDSDKNYFFVTASGQAFLASRPLAGRQRQVQPLWDDPSNPVSVLVRDARTSATYVFTRAESPMSEDKQVYFQLNGTPRRHPIPIDHFRHLDGQSDGKVVGKCVELLRKELRGLP